MKKINKKGFIMAETIAVSAVVVVTLVMLYAQFSSIYNGYYRSFKYNSVNNLYLARNVKDYINYNYNEILINALSNNENDYLDISDCPQDYFTNYSYCKALLEASDIVTLIFAKENLTSLKNNLEEESIFNEGINNFIKNINYEGDEYRIIIEFKDNTYATLLIDGEGSTSNICKRADVTTLHTETCDSSGSCIDAGYSTGSTIKYGNQTVTNGVLTSGDAFDCDVNGDGDYDPVTERFYYVSGKDGNINSEYAVLIYYNNTTLGVTDNTSASWIAYDSSNENWHGPVSAIGYLPTIQEWSNVSLSSITRAITTQTGTNSTTGGTLPTAFSYTNSDGLAYSARLLTTQEVESACNITVGSFTNGELDSCNYLMENTNYRMFGQVGGYWLETPYASNSNNAWVVSGLSRITGTDKSRQIENWGVRPVIEVLKSDIDYRLESSEINFTLTDDYDFEKTYTVPTGMTWGEWLNSDYYDLDQYGYEFISDEDELWFDDGTGSIYIYDSDENPVTKNDVIIAGQIYVLGP